jgi:hypothetical protein
MRMRKKAPFFSLETVFNHPSITSICQRADLLAELHRLYEDRGPIHQKLIELANELQIIVTERSFEHMDRDAAEKFIADWDDLSVQERLIALLSIYRKNIASAQQGDGK